MRARRGACAESSTSVGFLNRVIVRSESNRRQRPRRCLLGAGRGYSRLMRMTFRRIRLSIALSLPFALAVACGGDSNNSDPGAGGSAMNAGTSSGGTSSGGTSSGGTSSGGSTSEGGGNAAGDSTQGGAGMPMQPPGCPPTEPEVGTECMRRGGPGSGACTYGGDSCLCNANAWACYSQKDCPASAPDDAAACDLNGMSCAYDTLRCTCSTMTGWTCQEPCPQAQPDNDAECRRPTASTCRYQAGMVVQGFMGMADTTCACNDGKFVCFSQADCPANAPTTGDSCDTTTLSCAFTGARCTCDPNGSWTCTTDCPAMLPADGDACERTPQQTCRYNGSVPAQGMQADATCTCRDMKFECLTPADCPDTRPDNASTCDLLGLSCRYDNESCRCGTMSGTWNCFMTGGLPGAGGAGGAAGAGGANP